MRYEQLVLAPALLYMHDAIVNSEGTMDLLMDEKKHPTLEELGEHVYTAHSTFKGRAESSRVESVLGTRLLQQPPERIPNLGELASPLPQAR
ncbi:hypothetical protein CYMTET_41172 [Cymbomonas tetramitiformis]|uniref:Uncharacterized protein n=1 Tax=Cymbomonas tetramitiformis TaxID=36881 RepID=A0AAE0F2W8_9CHLO|nr:hypothetical protein CYMTET_41172 [Cymbomonas tetramitiformis]